MTTPVPPIELSLDAGGYITSLGSANEATDSFSNSIAAAAVVLAPLQKTLNSITPSRALLGGFVGFSAVAAASQKQMASLNATSKTTSANFDTLNKGTRELARQFGSSAGAKEIVATITKLGVATKGSERNVIELARVYTKLGGATGEGPAQLAAGMVQLSRVTGTGMNVDRMTKLGDSLTTVSAKSGSSATGILQFSKAIAPLANASGIGQTKILGISAAFSRLGEDGFGAANAFNKMLGDLNRSVREGSPEMAKYAQIVGKSAGEFEKLFKADPTEAITQVTEAIGKAGNRGPRLLEGIGLEGVRTQRYLQQLSSSGGLRQSIADATGGYGSGATEDASKLAFSNLVDSGAKLTTVLEQVAEALGRPFLGAITSVTDVLSGSVAVLTKGLESGPVQGTLKALSYAMLPALLAFKAIPAMLTGLGLTQVATSGPARGFLGGVARAGGLGAGLAGRLGGTAFNERQASGLPMGNRFILPFTNKAAEVGAGLGRFTQNGVVGGGPGIARMGLTGGLAGTGMYLRTLSESARNARTPFADRQSGQVRPFGAAYDNYSSRRAVLREDMKTGMIDRPQYNAQMRKAFVQLSADAGGAVGGIRMLSRGLIELGKQAGLSSLAVGGTVAKAAGSKLMSGLGGPVGLALTGFTAVSYFKGKSDEADAKRKEALANMTTFTDTYAVAMGKATQTASTFSGAMAAANKSTMQRVRTLAEAKDFTDEDERYATTAEARKSKVMDFSGGIDQAKRRIMMASRTSGVAPDELKRIQQDLRVAGYTRDQIKGATSGVSETADLGGDFLKDITASVGDIGKMKNVGGFKGFAAKNLNLVRDINNIGGGGDAGGSRLTISSLSDTQENRAAELVKGIEERQGKRAETYSGAYAANQSIKEINAAVAKAYKDNKTDLAESLQKAYQASAGVSEKNQSRTISKNDMEKSGGYAQALANLDSTYREGILKPTLADPNKDRATLDPGWVAKNIGQDSPLYNLLSATGSGSANKAVQALIGVNGKPEDPKLQVAAVQESIAAARASGSSMTDLARAATNAANKLGEIDAATLQFLADLRVAAMQQVAAQATFKSSGANLRDRASNAAFEATLDPSTKEFKERRTAGREALIGAQDETVARAKARIAQDREIQVQEKRMQADFVRQGVWQTKAYNLSIIRAEDDYGRQREIAFRDRRKSMLRGERDFAISLRRIAEDGARGMYDPYTRIQVQQTWDPVNLLGNLKEQNESIANQMKNLDKLRQQGGSSNLIKLLGLNDPKNSQQLANIIDDLARDPSVLASLNKAADTRQSLGGKLTMDKDNVSVGRSKEDFAKSLKDSTEDFKIAMADMAVQFKIGMNRAAEDRRVALDQQAQQYATTLERMRADVKRSDEEIVMDLGTLSESLTTLIAGQHVDFKDQTQSALDGTLKALRDFQGPYAAALADIAGVGSPGPSGASGFNPAAGDPGGGRNNLGSETGGHIPTKGQAVSMPGGYNKSDNKKKTADTRSLLYNLAGMSDVDGLVVTSAKRDKKDGSYHNKGQAIDIGGSTFSLQKLANYLIGLNKQGRIRLTEMIYQNPQTNDRYGIKNGSTFDYGYEQFRKHRTHVHMALNGKDAEYVENNFSIGSLPKKPDKRVFAKGGIMTKATEFRPGDIGGEAGPEAIIPLNAMGVTVLARALKQFMSHEDGKTLRAGQGRTYVTYDHSSTHHDNRTIIERVDLKAETPRQLVAEAEKMRRRSALTAPPQRKSR